MTKTIHLNDLQLVLLSHAARHEAGNMLPLPVTVADQARAHKELKALLRRDLLAETETTNPAASWRSEDDVHFALVITDRGRAAIGLGEAEANAVEEVDKVSPASATPTARHDVRPASKIAGVIALLGRKEGATLDELTGTTGWQAHTTRAALTGLRKKGHVIDKTKRGDTTCYRIMAELAP